MTSVTPLLSSVGLIGSGAVMAIFAGQPLISDSNFSPPLNPLGINGSPYGEVFAMAMQGPIHIYSDMGMNGQGHHHVSGEVCNHADHDDHTGDGNHDCQEYDVDSKPNPSPSLIKRCENFLTSLGEAQETRTNPVATTEAHKRHLRRQAEDKLRFANNLDPAHYGNYVCLHFFLIEPGIGTRPQLTSEITKLADDTIKYCLKDMDDPRPALTAAAAASHMLHMMFADEKGHNPNFNVKQMRYYMTVLDTCIDRYQN